MLIGLTFERFGIHAIFSPGAGDLRGFDFMMAKPAGWRLGMHYLEGQAL